MKAQDPSNDKIEGMERKKPIVKSVPNQDIHTAEELEHFREPDTSSLTAFLLSLFSCSQSGLRCADDPISSDHNDISMQQFVSITRPGDVKNRRQVRDSTCRGGRLQQRGSMAGRNEGSNFELEDDENEWQLITDNDLHDFDNCSSSSVQEQGVFLSDIPDTPVILPESLRIPLNSYLPTLVQGRDWVLLYSTRKHGISLLTLYRRSTHLSCPFLLVAEDSRGTVFGGLLSSPLNPMSRRKFQGTSETFVFTNISSKLSVFYPTGLNRYFFLCTNDALAFGGGGSFALHLDRDLLNGSSGCSDTFGNCCLAHEGEFTLKNVELWGFAHTSKYVPQESLFKEPMEAPGICRW